jgi:hypothetical protein
VQKGQRRTPWYLCSLILLLGCVGPAPAGYVLPASPGDIGGDWHTFVGDFASWNASLNNRPLLFLLSATPEERQLGIVLLWWSWELNHLHARPTAPHAAPGQPGSSPPGGQPPPAISSPPSLSGSVGTGSAGDVFGSPLGSPTPPPFIGQPGPDDSVLPGPEGGDSPGSGGTLADGSESSGAPLLEPFDSPPEGPLSCPEPASLALLGCGMATLLVGGYARRVASRKGLPGPRSV